MGGVAKRIGTVAGRWANSGAITPAGAAVGEMVGIGVSAPPVLGTAVGAGVGSLVGSVAEEMVDLATPLWQRRAANVDRMVRTAEDEAGMPAAELLRNVMADPALLELLATTAEAAARSLDSSKIDTLARVFVDGARDEADIDGAQIMVEVVRQLERPHLRLIQLLAGPNCPGGVDVGNDDPSLARWPPRDILAADRGLTGALEPLVSRLHGLGLVVDSAVGAYVGYETTWTLTPFGRRCAAYLSDRGSRAR